MSGVAQFGGARLGDGNSVGFDFNQGITQVIDNLSWIRGTHAYKGGIDAQWIADRARARRPVRLHVPDERRVPAAKNGTSAVRLLDLQQLFGNRSADYNSGFYGFFVQDDWQITPQLKVLYGLRYDLFDVPSARPFAANPYSQNFTVDKNNFAPRAGLSWAVDSIGPHRASARRSG